VASDQFELSVLIWNLIVVVTAPFALTVPLNVAILWLKFVVEEIVTVGAAITGPVIKGQIRPPFEPLTEDINGIIPPSNLN